MEDYRDLFKELHSEGDCSKLFLGGRGGVSTAGMVCAFTPSGVMVACKVLPTPESPYDVVDFVTWMKVRVVVRLVLGRHRIAVCVCVCFGMVKRCVFSLRS